MINLNKKFLKVIIFRMIDIRLHMLGNNIFLYEPKIRNFFTNAKIKI